MQAGEFAEEGKLPPQAELAHQYRVGALTISDAIRAL
ncbi:GntR family transcriptional regulator [Actinomadura darangshiensis]|uniref:GntR family transcriptional regulator n=1 Tax=Actinomadura darangshiensis TaxID=705336 RepID=A0A4R5BST6_9ACTN|nr:GntR family transcriptional regulator [Actinomadura darangshiensis]